MSYTYISERGHSTVDHVLCSIDMINLIHDMRIENRMESDHLPVSFRWGANCAPIPRKWSVSTLVKYKWDDEKKDGYKNNLCSEENEQDIGEALNMLNTDVNCSLEKIQDVILKAGDDMKVVIKNGQNKGNKNAWFDNECKLAKKEAKHALTRECLAGKKDENIRNERMSIYKAKESGIPKHD